MSTEPTAASWARWVRGLAVLCGVLLVFAGAEAFTIRAARAEIATLRAEREQARAGVAKTWLAMPADDFVRAGAWLDSRSAHQDYLRRPGGLCTTGHPDFKLMADYILGHYVPERAAGRSHDAGLEAMRLAIMSSDEWKRVQGK